jgi:hypothetical protein
LRGGCRRHERDAAVWQQRAIIGMELGFGGRSWNWRRARLPSLLEL